MLKLSNVTTSLSIDLLLRRKTNPTANSIIASRYFEILNPVIVSNPDKNVVKKPAKFVSECSTEIARGLSTKKMETSVAIRRIIEMIS